MSPLPSDESISLMTWQPVYSGSIPMLCIEHTVLLESWSSHPRRRWLSASENALTCVSVRLLDVLKAVQGLRAQPEQLRSKAGRLWRFAGVRVIRFVIHPSCSGPRFAFLRQSTSARSPD